MSACRGVLSKAVEIRKVVWRQGFEVPIYLEGRVKQGIDLHTQVEDQNYNYSRSWTFYTEVEASYFSVVADTYCLCCSTDLECKSDIYLNLIGSEDLLFFVIL